VRHPLNEVFKVAAVGRPWALEVTMWTTSLGSLFAAALCVGACSHATPRASGPAAARPDGDGLGAAYGESLPTEGGAAGVSADESKQPVPRFERVPVGDTGFEAFVPRGFPTFEANTSQDGSLVASGELAVGDFHFVVIGVRFKQALAPEDAEGVLEGYLDFLKTQLSIKEAAGYGKGHRLDDEPEARGMIDFWVDKDGDEWAIKGWVTPKHLVFFAVYGRGEYPYFNAKQMFFEGVRFPRG